MKSKSQTLFRSFGGAVCAGAVVLIGFSAPAQDRFIDHHSDRDFRHELPPDSGLSQDLFVADSASGNIYQFAPDGGKSIFAAGMAAPGLEVNAALAVDGAGNVFVANYVGGNITKVTPQGEQSTFASGLSVPAALACNSAGDLFEADYGSGNIYEFTPAGVRSTFASGLSNPIGMAIDSMGDLFVSDSGSGRIYEFTPGGFKTTFASGLSNPYALAINGAGDVFAATFVLNQLNELDFEIIEIAPGGAITTVGTDYTAALNSPTEMACDAAGDLFVADNGDQAIWEFSRDTHNPNLFTESAFVSSLSVSSPGVGVASPAGLAFNSAGNLFEADGTGNIYQFTPDGTQSTFATLLSYSAGLAINRRGDLFVGTGNMGHIYKFTPNGERSLFATVADYSYPVGLAFNEAGDLFGASYWFDNDVYEFTPAGVQSTFASGLSMPSAVAFDGAGNMFEADYGSGNIYEFTPAGTQSTFATGLSGPDGLAFDSKGNLFEADNMSGNIYEFTPAGTRSTYASGLSSPNGLALNSAGDLFVGVVSPYTGMGSIYEITPDGTQFVLATGFFATTLNQPMGMAFSPRSDRSQTVYVGNPALAPVNGGPDGVPPLVIMGEYNPSGPLADSTAELPSGTVQDVKFYGQNYDFTLYALSHTGSGQNGDEQTFKVVAAQHFSGSNPTPGTITLEVPNFHVKDGDVLAFAGIGPFYPQQPNDALDTGATFENSAQQVGYDNDTAAAPVLDQTFSVGINRDPNTTYGYIADNFGNQGRTYAIGVDVKVEEGGHLPSEAEKGRSDRN